MYRFQIFLQVTESIITPHLKYLNLLEPEVEDVYCTVSLTVHQCIPWGMDDIIRYCSGGWVFRVS